MGEGLAPKEQQERILGGDRTVLCFDCGSAGHSEHALNVRYYYSRLVYIALITL